MGLDRDARPTKPSRMQEPFLEELDALISARLAAIADEARAGGEAQSTPVTELLVMALKKELEAAEEAALWLTTEPDIEVKLALARQCGDEAKHFRLIEARLEALGIDPATKPEVPSAPSPMFTFLAGLTHTVERIAAGPYAREALAKALNEAFIDYCEARGDAGTARLYRERIQPDEEHHHALGRSLLARMAVSEEDRDRARRATLRTLEIAEEIQQIVRVKRGVACAPGC